MIHDPQPLSMIHSLVDRFDSSTFVWRCHLDLSSPDQTALQFIESQIRYFDKVILSHPAYRTHTDVPSTVIFPSIDPLSEKNRLLSGTESAQERAKLPLNFDSPVLTQVSRFDPWKGQWGVVQAIQRLNHSHENVQLVLVGGFAGDDPEGQEIYTDISKAVAAEPDIHLLLTLPSRSVNNLQSESAVVLQNSSREGFGLVVSEALWKRTPVIGTQVGGIGEQIIDGVNGILVVPDILSE